jgi:hypothetical protein
MRASRWLSASLLAGILWMTAVTPLIPSSGGGLMPCCAEGRPCGPQLQATGCCRIDAASDRAVGLAPAVTRSPGSFKAHLSPVPVLPAFADAMPNLARMALGLAAESPPRVAALPIYLMTAALLR